ncbi:MAG: hypothetical protein ACK41Y_01545 [Paracoccus hibiscisoli]|uniref:hypothetical protein n=1 Tax=Paracoccus hibiscisoli TaxID=2023261 RepID=UPI00391D3F69
MSFFAAAKSANVLDQASEIREFFDALDLTTAFRKGENAQIVSAFSSLILAIPFTKLVKLRQPNLPVERINPAYAFSACVFFRAFRALTGVSRSANPTWLKKAVEQEDPSDAVVLSTLHALCSDMLNDISSYFGPGSVESASALIGDARRLPLPSNSVDRVITSPPYLTRIDYAMSTMPELLLLGGTDSLTKVRHATMGAPVITKGDRHQLETWGPICNDLLSKIKSHHTKAAQAYYWKNIVKYFMDADESLHEIKRTLKSGGSGIIVVQSSYFKELEIPLGEIYVQMAGGAGLAAEIVFRQEVRGHLAHVNTRSTKYKAGKVYYEDFVLIRKS